LGREWCGLPATAHPKSKFKIMLAHYYGLILYISYICTKM
jgi:hypothetical protein